MNPTRRAMIALFFAASCTHDLGRPLDRELDMLRVEAEAALRQGHVDAARTIYAKILDADPNDAEAAFGWALTDLALFPLSDPVRHVIKERCNQPDFDPELHIFGPNGILARDSGSRAGNSAANIHFFPSAGAGATKVLFSPTTIRTEWVQSYETSPPRPKISMSLHDASTDAGVWLTIDLNPDDLTKNDMEIVPLRDGAVVEVAQLDGRVYLYEPGRYFDAPATYSSNVPISGRLRFTKGGSATGQQLAVEFEDVFLPAVCPSADCTSLYNLSGTIEDTITPKVDLDWDQVPWGRTEEDNGVPRVPSYVVALEQCNPVDADFVLAQARELGKVFEKDAARLRIASQATDKAKFRFIIPHELLSSHNDLVLNAIDARALAGAVDIVAAALELASHFRLEDGPLQNMVQERNEITSAGINSRVRDFEPSLLVENLAATFLTRAPGFELTTFKTRLDRGLADLSAALTDTEQAPLGLFDFDAAPSRRLISEIAAGLDAMRASIDSPNAVAWSSSPLYQFHWRAYLDAPLDRDNLLALTGLDALVALVPADPNAVDPVARNPTLDWRIAKPFDALYEFLNSKPKTAHVVDTWFGGLLKLPPERDGAPGCMSALECGAGYGCIDQECIAELPWVLTEAGWNTSVREDWPVFVSLALRDALGL